MASQFTNKQQEFINAYLGVANFNATEAARIAGYKGNGNTLAAVGSENLRKPNIAAEIKVRLQASAMQADELLMLLGRQARSKNIVAKYLTPEGVDVEAMIKDGHGNLIKSMKPGKYGMVVEFVDDLKSQELIARNLGILVDRSEVTEINAGSLTDFEEWKRKQSERENEAMETLRQFDEED
jgi:phage terminase small subunit